MKILHSIKIINYLIFFSVICFNIFSYFKTDLETFKLYYLLINFFLFFLFFLFNFSFNREENKQRKVLKDLSKLNNDNYLHFIKGRLLKKVIYSENDNNLKIFKNIFIRKNLVKKDYDDLKNIFLKFVPEGFLNEVGEKGTEKIALGSSVKKDLHVMFLDIIGFTSISEKLLPEKALLLLNVYFDGIVEIIKSYDGYVDKYLGDGIMIIFNSKNSDNALRAAVEIQDFIRKINFSEIGKKISIGIGINSGDVILGTIGAKDRMEITVIGDTVNIASRLEGLTREMGDLIIISKATLDSLKNKNSFKIQDLGYKKLKGKTEKIKIFGVHKK